MKNSKPGRGIEADCETGFQPVEPRGDRMRRGESCFADGGSGERAGTGLGLGHVRTGGGAPILS